MPLVLPGAADLMHPTLARDAFTRDGWLFEHKLDGFRALGRRTATAAELISRNGLPLGPAFPEVLEALHELPVDTVVDCELVLTDATGRPLWGRLSRRARMTKASSATAAAREEPATLCMFDVLVLVGLDVRPMPLTDRKALLGELCEADPTLHVVDFIEAHGEALFATACELGLEGVVAKRADAPYTAGRRDTWLKVKNPAYYRRNEERHMRR